MRRTASMMVVLLLGSIAAAVPAAAQAERDSSAPEMRWEACHPEAGPSFECTTVRVPLDHDDPDGRRISLSLVRLPASSGESEGSIFFNPGGPGGSGVDFLLAVGPFLYSDEVRARFDLIGFDPRGIARSTPLRCFQTAEDAVTVLPPFPFPLDRAEAALWAALDRTLDAACRANARAIHHHHMSTANVARDMDLMRRALGDDGLTYIGYSYGSFLGTVYANLFPDSVRAVVVDAILDPIAWTTGRDGNAATLPFSTRLRSDAGAQATLDEFFRLCDEAGPPACAFAPDSAARYAALADRLLAEPVLVTDPETGETVLLSYAQLVGLSLGPLYNSFSWPEFAALLAAIEAFVGPEDLGVAVEATLEAAGVGISPFAREYNNFVEGFPGVACTDSVNPDGHRFWWEAGLAAEAEFDYFRRLWTWASGPCAVWSAIDEDRYLGPFTNETANPVLIVGNRFDPATRYEGAEILRDLLPNSSLITLEGWGHASLFLSACVDAAVSEYLLTAMPPADGTICTQDVGPFDAVAAPTTLESADVARAERRAEVLRGIAIIPRG